MPHTKALVTLTIGRSHQDKWRRYCQANWQAYADRHGYDIVVFDQLLDDSPRGQQRAPVWQKCLIPGHPRLQRYVLAVWVDADVLINPDSPCIVSQVPDDLVGAVDEFASPTPEIYRQTLATQQALWRQAGLDIAPDDTAQRFYTNFGLPHGYDQVVQGGVMVFSPARHAALFEAVYHGYEDRPESKWLHEMRPLSFELLRAGVVHWLDCRFNRLWVNLKVEQYPFLLAAPDHPLAAQCLSRALAANYFLHFAGMHQEMALVAPPRSAPAPRPAPRPAPPQPALDVPVVVLLFNRPEPTAQVMQAVRQAKPRQLLLVADGPRPDRPGEAELCAQARHAAQQVDWPCQVRTHFAETNLGLKRRVVSGLNWVFEQVESAIIFEDDCLPDATFFPFAAEVLQRYAADPRVMGVAASNFLFGRPAGPDSYYFSRYPLCWGWATWRRAWKLFDPDMRAWPALRDSGWLDGLLQDRNAVRFWTHAFDKASASHSIWDYAWTFANWLHDGQTIVPAANLVTNLGFGPHATHTTDPLSPLANMPAQPIDFPLRHPAQVARRADADAWTDDLIYGGTVRRALLALRQASLARRQRQGAALP